MARQAIRQVKDDVAQQDAALVSHLLRRAGFGSGPDELERCIKQGYEATVEELLHPEQFEPVDDYTLFRYHPITIIPGGGPEGQVKWAYWLVTTKRPLEEKMTLFWHNVFATAISKVDCYHELWLQISALRRRALDNYREVLNTVAQNPAMIFWLDNNENHRYNINENWGRELLELFSMGVGNYTETDIKEASRAFTGWTINPKIPKGPFKRFNWTFDYKPEDHDDKEKSFLGKQGRFNGEDVIEIIVQQPATARFLSRHLYSFFVADEPQVPSWSIISPRDEAAVETLSKAFVDSGFDMRSVLRLLFNSDFFKNSRFQRTKSPAEFATSVLRLVGGHDFPQPKDYEWAKETGFMGQELMNPPSVEGWHTGKEWINSGTLMRRTNFAAKLVSDTGLPGVARIVDRVRGKGSLGPEGLVDATLSIMGPLEVTRHEREQLIAHAQKEGALAWQTDQDVENSTRRVGEMLQLIVALPEYQLA